jgi:hypothetical protein
MQPKQLMLLLTICTFACTAKAQEYQPYKEIGKKVKVLTLSNGKYDEFFDYKDIQRIGSVMFNIRTKKIVKLLNADSIFKKFSNNSSASRWYSPDPLSDKFSSFSPYNFVENNPINRIDPDGRESTSTHTDKNGKVLAVYNDNDLGVYKHDDATTKEDVDKKYYVPNSEANKYGTDYSAGGIKMGETPYWDEFLSSHPNTQTGQREPTSSDGVTPYVIKFGEGWGPAITKLTSAASKMSPWNVATQSMGGGTLSLQDQVEYNGQGRLFSNGKYASTESIGNYIAGYNAAQAGMPTYDGFQRIAGALELKTHGYPNIPLDTKAMIKLATGITSYGTFPLYGELIQQYRWSTQGWSNFHASKIFFK